MKYRDDRPLPKDKPICVHIEPTHIYDHHLPEETRLYKYPEAACKKFKELYREYKDNAIEIRIGFDNSGYRGE